MWQPNGIVTPRSDINKIVCLFNTERNYENVSVLATLEYADHEP